jgi:AbrB family looped-hinge helix DNA binding protein
MDIAKVTAKGQLTVPKAVREKLNLETGSKVVFLQKGDDLVVRNAETLTGKAPKDASEHPGFYRMTEDSLPAFRRLQEAFKGFAEEEGLETEQDVVDWLKRFDDSSR